MSLRELLRSWVRPQVRPRPPAALDELRAMESASDYARRSREELERFDATCDVNDLPPIFGYWSHTHLRPMCETLGFSYPEDFYAQAIMQRAATGRTTRVLSVGAGNCDTELRIAGLLQERGFSDYSIVCLDLSAQMLERGRRSTVDAGLASRFDFLCADFNAWQGQEEAFDLVIANQCLHHVVELERLFDRIPTWLQPQGALLTSDMIGRNGHMRWPEARALVDEFWNELPTAYRHNRALQRQETQFEDWDCSVEGFEGIRSQDILPLMCERFGFELFVGFGNVVDPFIDRSFGWNFDADAEWDRGFIDRVHARDEAAMDAGTITPCHMFAIATLDRSARPRVWHDRTPQRSIRLTP